MGLLANNLFNRREKFRKRKGWGGLSVSDLVGPSWCEVGSSVLGDFAG